MKVNANHYNKPPRYPPVAEKWSDVALKKCRTNFRSKEISTHFYIFHDEECEINVRDTLLKPRKAFGRIPAQTHDIYKTDTIKLDNEKESEICTKTYKADEKYCFVEEPKKELSMPVKQASNYSRVKLHSTNTINTEDKVKKSVRFNDNDLCTFAPTQESFGYFPIMQESGNYVFQDSESCNKDEIKTNVPVSMEQISECLQETIQFAPANKPKTPAEKRQYLEELKDKFSLKQPSYHDINNETGQFEIEPYSEDKTIIDESSFSSSSDLSKNITNKQESTVHLDAENNPLIINSKLSNQLMQTKVSSFEKVTISHKDEYSDDEYVPPTPPIQTANINIERQFKARLYDTITERNSDKKQFEEVNEKQLYADDCKVDFERTMEFSPGLSDRDYDSIGSDKDNQIGDIHRREIDKQIEETTPSEGTNNKNEEKIQDKLVMLMKSGDIASELERDLPFKACRTNSENASFQEIENVIPIQNELDGDDPKDLATTVITAEEKKNIIGKHNTNFIQDQKTMHILDEAKGSVKKKLHEATKFTFLGQLTSGISVIISPQDDYAPLTNLPSKKDMNSQSPLWRHTLHEGMHRSEFDKHIEDTTYSKITEHDIEEKNPDNEPIQYKIVSSFERVNINQKHEYSDDEYVPLSSPIQTAYINYERPFEGRLEASKQIIKETITEKTPIKDVIRRQLTADVLRDDYNKVHGNTLDFSPGLSDRDYVSIGSENDKQIESEVDNQIEETTSSIGINNANEEKIHDKLLMPSIFVSGNRISIMKNADKASQLNKCHLLEEDNKLNSQNSSFNETEHLIHIKNKINLTSDLISPVITKATAQTSEVERNTDLIQVKKKINILDQIKCSNENNVKEITTCTYLGTLESTPCGSKISHIDDSASINNAPSKNANNSQSPNLSDKFEINILKSNQTQMKSEINNFKTRRALFLNRSYCSLESASDNHHSKKKYIKEQRSDNISDINGLKDRSENSENDAAFLALKQSPNIKRVGGKRTLTIDKEYNDTINLDFLEPCLLEKLNKNINYCSTEEDNSIHSSQGKKEKDISQLLQVNVTGTLSSTTSSTTSSTNFQNGFTLLNAKGDLKAVQNSDSESLKPCTITLKSAVSTQSGKNTHSSIQNELSTTTAHETRTTLNNSDSDIVKNSNSDKLINENMKVNKISINIICNEISKEKIGSISKHQEKEKQQCMVDCLKDEERLRNNLESIPKVVAQTNKLKLVAPKYNPVIEIKDKTDIIDIDINSLIRQLSDCESKTISDTVHSLVRVPDDHIEYSLVSTGNSTNQIEATEDSQAKFLNDHIKRTALSTSKITKKSKTDQHIVMMKSSSIKYNQKDLKSSGNIKHSQQSLDRISSGNTLKCSNIGSEKPKKGSFPITPPDSQILPTVEICTFDQRLAAANWDQSLVDSEEELGNNCDIRRPFRANVGIANNSQVEKNYPTFVKSKNKNIKVFTSKKSEENTKMNPSTNLKSASTKKSKLRLSKYLGSSVTNIKIGGKQNKSLMEFGDNFSDSKPQHSNNKAKHLKNKKPTTAKYPIKINESGSVNEKLKTLPTPCPHADKNDFRFSKTNKNNIQLLDSKGCKENTKTSFSPKLSAIAKYQCAVRHNQNLRFKSARNIKIGEKENEKSIMSTVNNISNSRTQNSSIKANSLKSKKQMIDNHPTQMKGTDSQIGLTNDKIKIIPICSTNEPEIQNSYGDLDNIQNNNTRKSSTYDFDYLFSKSQITNSSPDFIRGLRKEKALVDKQLHIDTRKSANNSPSKSMCCTDDESSSQDSFFEKYSKRAFNTTDSDTSIEDSRIDDLLINDDSIDTSSEIDNQSLSRYHLQMIKKRKRMDSSPLSNLFNEEEASSKKLKTNNTIKNSSNNNFNFKYTVTDDAYQSEEGESVFDNGALNCSDYKVESPSENGEYSKLTHVYTSESTSEPNGSAFPTVTDDATSLSSYNGFRDDFDDLFDSPSPSTS